MPDSRPVPADPRPEDDPLEGPDPGASGGSDDASVGTPEAEDALGHRPRLRRPSRRVMTILSIPLVLAVIGSYVGDALAPELVNSNPLLLLILNPRNRNLLLITNQLDPVTYYLVGTLRLVLTDPLWYLIGIWYGEAAIRWAERRTRTFGETLRWMERGFSKAAYPLVFIAPNNWICLFAGAAGMPVAAFAVLNVTGTAARLWVVREVGEAFESPIDSLLGFIADYRVPLLVASIALVALTIYSESRKGGGDIGAISDLERFEDAERAGGAGRVEDAERADGSDRTPGAEDGPAASEDRS